MKHIYRYHIIITAFLYVLSFMAVGGWFMYRLLDFNVEAVFFVYEPGVVNTEDGRAFEPYIREDGTYGQVSDFFNFRECELYKRVKETKQEELYHSNHRNYQGKDIYTYCRPFYIDDKFAGVFCVDIPIRINWLIIISVIILLGVSLLIWSSLRLYRNIREMTVNDLIQQGQLHLAAKLQQQILPAELPKHPAIELSSFYKSALNVGGDLYDARLEGDLLTFCIGDISGHGLPAALLMSQMVGIERAIHGSPAEMMSTLNAVLAENNPDMQFCTMFIGQLNVTNGVLTFCNAGHPVPEFTFHGQPLTDISSPLMDTLNGQLTTVFPPLGIDLSTRYSDQSAVLPAGMTIRLFTDGVYEDEDDDISRLDITWKARLENLHPWLLAQGEENNMTELAIEEALVNVVKHSTATDVLLLPVTSSSSAAQYMLMDNGIPFDPTTAVSQSDGVGLNIIRELGAPAYERKEDLNCLMLTFGQA